MKNNKSFTLIEVLVVVVIIGIIASIILISLGLAKNKAGIAAGLQFEANIHNSLGAYAIGIWDFNEGVGVSAADASGFNNNLIIFGSPNWIPKEQTPSGKGYALSFNGSDNYAAIRNLYYDKPARSKNLLFVFGLRPRLAGGTG